MYCGMYRKNIPGLTYAVTPTTSLVWRTAYTSMVIQCACSAWGTSGIILLSTSQEGILHLWESIPISIWRRPTSLGIHSHIYFTSAFYIFSTRFSFHVLRPIYAIYYWRIDGRNWCDSSISLIHRLRGLCRDLTLLNTSLLNCYACVLLGADWFLRIGQPTGSVAQTIAFPSLLC